MDKLPLLPIPITPKAITSRKRSLAMTITWRIVAEIDTLLVSYLITGSWAWSLSIVGIESTTKTFLYYCHERAWGHILRAVQRSIHDAHGEDCTDAAEGDAMPTI